MTHDPSKVVVFILINRLGNYTPTLGVVHECEGQKHGEKDYFIYETASKGPFSELQTAIDFIQKNSPPGSKRYLTPFIPNLPGMIWLCELGNHEGVDHDHTTH